jgi:hypothetical protein
MKSQSWKTKFLALAAVLSIGSMTAAPRANALIVGAGTGNPILIIGGATLTGVGVVTALAGSQLNDYSEKRAWVGGFGIFLTVVGLVLDDQTVSASQAAEVKIQDDLKEKVDLGFYAAEDAEKIYQDFTAYQARHAGESLQFELKDAAQRTGADLSQELTAKTGMQTMTVNYLLSSFLGIQAQK